MDCAASRSILGVWNFLLAAVIESQKGTEVSCHPMSSTRKTMIFGWLVAFCCALVKYCNPKIKTNIIKPIFLSLLTIITTFISIYIVALLSKYYKLPNVRFICAFRYL